MNPHTTLSSAAPECKEQTCCREQTHLERIARFSENIEKGILDKMGEIGVPCKGLGQNVLGCIGMCEEAFGLKKIVRFVHANFDGWTAEEDMSGHLSVESGDPGCFPKLRDKDETLYIFPTAKDALKARYVWKAAGLGVFPAYSLSGISKSFPAKNLVFVDLCGKIADPMLIRRAMRLCKMVVSEKISIDLQGLRSLAYNDPALHTPDMDPPPEMKPAGKTENGQDIFQGPDGYYIRPKPGYDLEKQTNFTFEPKVIYASDYPVLRNILFSELRIGGEKIAENIPTSGMTSHRFGTMLRKARAYKPGGIVFVKNQKAFANADFDNMQATELKFPCTPCVCENEGVIFPKFRVTQAGLVPHPQLEPIISSRRKSHDYKAMTAEPASDEDMKALAGLMRRQDESSKIVVMGICSWLHMVISAQIAVLHDTSFTDLCFEIHSVGNEACTPMASLYALFSGDAVPRNSVEYRSAYKNRTQTCSALSAMHRFAPLPGFFSVAMSKEGRMPYNVMYMKTKAPGLYAVSGSDLRHPLNAHGNMQCTVIASTDAGIPDLPIARIRRAITHILLQYVKAAPRIDADRWMTRKPWISMYSGLYRALYELGLNIPEPERFERKNNGY